jgi:hypothetical protein
MRGYGNRNCRSSPPSQTATSLVYCFRASLGKAKVILVVRTVPIQSVRIDDDSRIRIRPEADVERGGYALIYRAAGWVRWDSDSKELFVTPEKVEELESQFARIVRVLLGECGDHLRLTSATDFTNVPPEVVASLKTDMT